MKLATRILSLLILAAFATFYMSCDGGGGDDQTEEQKQFNKLKSTWALEGASEDGVSRTDDFADLQLTLTGTFAQGGVFQYSLTGTRPNPSPWPEDGTWRFDSSDPTHKVIRDSDDNEITMEYEVTADALEISFEIPEGHTGWAGSRTGSVTGDWVFTFTKVQ